MNLTHEEEIDNLRNKLGDVSYGTLGILNTIIKQSYQTSVVKKNMFLVNVGTIVRNCFDKDATDKTIIDKATFDVTNIRSCLARYDDKVPDAVVFYYKSSLLDAIPEHQRRKVTPMRARIASIIKQISAPEVYKPNRLMEVPTNNDGNTATYALEVTTGFAYHQLARLMRNAAHLSSNNRIWMFTHNPIDFFLADTYPNLEIIESHTGRIFGPKDFAKKVFKKDKEGVLPFNRVTYKLFGDKEFITPLAKNFPKALLALKGINLKIRTEAELIQIAKDKLGINKSQFNWKL